MEVNNSVELLGYYGSDSVIACSAWTSTSRNLTADKKLRIPKLIDMLWSKGHETPFEKGHVHFLVRTDIATHIHLLKHRISSLNAESARYKELKDDRFMIPNDWYHNDVLLKWVILLKEQSDKNNRLYHQCINELEPVLGRKRAKESARYFKMYNSVIEADIMFNFRSFANFQKLRNSSHAQLEVQSIANIMWQKVKQLAEFEHTCAVIEKYTIKS